MNNEEILEMNNYHFHGSSMHNDHFHGSSMHNGNKFDILLSNPPFNLGVKFFQKYFEIADKIITIQPSNWLFGNSQNKQLIKNIKNVYCDITKYKRGYGGGFDAGFGNELSINYINNLKTKKLIIDGKEFDDIENIRHYSGDKYIEEFNNISKSLYTNDNIKNHILEFEIGEYVNDDDWCVKIPEIRGHRGANGVLDDFYSIISPNDKFTFENTVGQFKNIKIKTKRSDLKYYIKLDSKDAAYNFINYVKTDFVRTLLYISKMNTAVANGPTLRFIPWFDFSDEHFSKSPREIDNWLFNKYNISDEIRKHIEEILPDYYDIRKEI